MSSSFKTLRDYLCQSGKAFVVPNYQRGYKWSVKDKAQPSHVEKLCDDLIEAHKDKRDEYFLQGITVSETDEKCILIDGQQRTTTLYLMLWCFGEHRIKGIELEYDIRYESNKFIHRFHETGFQPGESQKNDAYQDIHYFKVAVEQIKIKMRGMADDFADYILDHVKVLYINIEHDKAVKTFTMMNGNKATMLPEELIKAEMLRLVSLSVSGADKEPSFPIGNEITLESKESVAREWEINTLRSRYAREWDKWLYWWNRSDVKSYFDVCNPMGLLLEYHFKRERHKGAPALIFTFQTFKSCLLCTQDKKNPVKEQFKKLRDLQKSFEDIFNTPKIYNHLKLALIGANNEDKFNIIQYFMRNKNHADTLLRDYAKWRLVGAMHREITQSDALGSEEITKEERAQEVLEQLSGAFVYGVCNDLALKQLLRLNVEADNQLNDGTGRKFDFNIYGKKSLEHVHPKSKAYHQRTDGLFYDGNDKPLLIDSEPKGHEWISRGGFGEGGSEHCIGNLVLLDKDDNALFNDKPFLEKKEIYFKVDKVFKSRNLLHSISIFARSAWDIKVILETQKSFIARFERDYGLQEGGPNV